MSGHPLQPQSPDDSEESWLSKLGYLRLSEGQTTLLHLPDVDEAKPNQVRAQGQPKSSDIALCCDGGLLRWHGGKESACQWEIQEMWV